MTNEPTELEETWKPGVETVSNLSATYPRLDIRAEFDKFQEYWINYNPKGKADKRHLKKNWNLAFIKWCHNAIAFQKDNTTKLSNYRQSTKYRETDCEKDEKLDAVFGSRNEIF